jgi:uncharacterized protein
MHQNFSDHKNIGRNTPMKPSQALQSHRSAIRSVVELHHACNARVFGSVAHGNDVEGSDLDILIDTTPETSLMDVATIQVKLEKLLGISVDVLTPRGLPEKFRNTVLAEAVPV